MKIPANSKRRQIACCLVILLMVPLAEAASMAPQATASDQQAATTPAMQSQNPDSASATANPATSQPSTDPSSSSGVSPDEPGQEKSPATLPPAPQQQQNGESNPVGTAAAPYEKPTGIPASRPAGAVVAPGKQKRSRSFLIRVGLIVGACVAVGAVVGMSAASPSRP
jgi:cytoskeletal protein RodZ